MLIRAGRLRYPHRLQSRISWSAEAARTCWLNWGRVPPQREELPLAVATVQLSPPLEQLEPLAWLLPLLPLVPLVLLVLLVPLVPLVGLVPSVPLVPLVPPVGLVPSVLQGWRVWPPPVAWLRGPVHP